MEDQQLTQQLLTAVTRLNRSIRTVKLLLGFFFLLFVGMLAILGYITYRVVTFTQDINNRITSFESKTTQTLDVRQQLCSNKNLTSLLGSGSEVCK